MMNSNSDSKICLSPGLSTHLQRLLGGERLMTQFAKESEMFVHRLHMMVEPALRLQLLVALFALVETLLGLFPLHLHRVCRLVGLLQVLQL
jgi:hypothetical protein